MAIPTLEKTLQEVGLNPNHISTYICLLQSGPRKASFIAKKIETAKSSTLDTLAALVKLGLVSKVKKQNSYLFNALEPSKIIDLLKQRETELKRQQEKVEKILPQLKNLQNIASPMPQIEYLEGTLGLTEAFKDTLQVPNKTILCYGTVAEQDKHLPIIFPEYYNERVKRKISTICLIPADKASIKECLHNDQKHLRKTYFIPKDMALPMEINIYENNTAIMSFEEKFAVIIRSKPVADCWRTIFNLSFLGAKQYDHDIRTAALASEKFIAL